MTTAEKRKIWTEGYNQNKEAFDARIKDGRFISSQDAYAGLPVCAPLVSCSSPLLLHPV